MIFWVIVAVVAVYFVMTYNSLVNAIHEARAGYVRKSHTGTFTCF